MRNSLLILLVIILFISSTSRFTQAIPQSEQSVPAGRLIIVSVPGLSFQEIDDLKQYSGWQPFLYGKVAAMNVRTPEAGVEDTYLSIGAGAPAIARGEAQGWMSTEKLGIHSTEQLMRMYTGKSPNGQMIVPNWIEMKQLNASLSYSAKLGSLGDMLHQHGVSRYVFGSRDRVEPNVTKQRVPLRHAPLMLADHHGEVSNGLIGSEVNIVSDDRPYGLRTNYELIAAQLNEINKPAIALVELGDLDRLVVEKNKMTQIRFTALKQDVLEEIGHFLEFIRRDLQPSDAIWLFSPLPHHEARKQKSMFTPFMMQGDESELAQWLTSQTTRRPGIITYADLTASILAYFNLDIPEEVRGMEIVSLQEDRGIDSLLKEVEHVEYVYKLRPKLIYPLVTFQMGALLLSLIYLIGRKKINIGLQLWHKHGPERMETLLKVMLFSVSIAPLLLLFVGAWPQVSETQTIILFCSVLLLAGWLSSRLPLYLSFIVIGFATAGAIVLDGLFGASFMQYSVLGYDPMIGARYYGIGNEYMGVLIGAALLAFSALHERLSSEKGMKVTFVCAIICGFGLLAYLAAPALGTNAGGAITAALAFSLFFLLLLRKHTEVRLTTIALVGGIGLVVSLSVLWVLNGLLPSTEAELSHIGKALNLLFSGRFDMIVDIVQRKLAMNLRLLGVSSWSKLLVSGLVVIGVLSLYAKTSRFQRWKKENPSLSSGLTAIFFGAMTAFVVNDSGIVAGALMIIYASVPMLLVHLNYTSDSHSVNKDSS